MVTKENLKDYANKLMFDMEENEYETLEKEFGKTFWFYLNFINPYRKK